MRQKRRRVAIDFAGQKKMTRDSEQYLTDIERIKQQGLVPPDPNQLNFADVSDFPDYTEARNEIIRIDEKFAQLPSKVRARFRNDPSELIAFLRDPNNRGEAVDLGILPAPEPAPEPVKKPAAKTADPEPEKGEGDT